MTTMAEYYYDTVNPIVKSINKDLSAVNYMVAIKHEHVISRLIDRNIPPACFMSGLKLMSSKLCELIYYTNLDKPFYSFDIKTNDVILAIGFQSSDSDKSRFVIRTVLDPEIHSKHGKPHIIQIM